MRTKTKLFGKPWKDATIEKEWDDGFSIVRVSSADDLATLSEHGGGCARDHAFWTEGVKPACEYFFVLMTPKGVGPILFCKAAVHFGKKHPTRDPNNGWITSDYYDHYYKTPEDMARARTLDLRRAEDNLRYYKEEAERIREYALRMGPLGKDHPQKYRVDEANAMVNRARGNLERAKTASKVHPGLVFKYGRRKLVIIQHAGKGTDYYDSPKASYTDKLAEFLGVANGAT